MIDRQGSKHRLVQTLWWSHGGLDVQRTDVLPVLLQKRDQEVDRQVDVLGELIGGHVDVTDGDGQAQDLKWGKA